MFNVFSNEPHSPVAQLAEQQTVNLWVRSSSLRGGAKLISVLEVSFFVFKALCKKKIAFFTNFLEKVEKKYLTK